MKQVKKDKILPKKQSKTTKMSRGYFERLEVRSITANDIERVEDINDVNYNDEIEEDKENREELKSYTGEHESDATLFKRSMMTDKNIVFDEQPNDTINHTSENDKYLQNKYNMKNQIWYKFNSKYINEAKDDLLKIKEEAKSQKRKIYQR